MDRRKNNSEHLESGEGQSARSKGKGVILVTGASGQIGKGVVKRLGSEFSIVGFELMRAIYASANEELVPCDISSEESVHQALAHIRNFYGNHITSVIHLAAYYSFSQQHSELYQKITEQGTERLLKGLRDFQVDQFIFSSTMLVHSPVRRGEKVNEESPLHAKWAYPQSKIYTEEIIRRERSDIPVVILRIAGVYDDECHSIPLAHQIQRIYEKEINGHLFAGNLEHGTSFLHMNDLVDAIEKIVHLRKSLPQELTLLLGEPTTLSYKYLQQRISYLIYGKEWRTYSIPKPIAKVGAWLEKLVAGKNAFIQPWMIDLADDNYDLDISKAESLLEWSPKHNLDKTLPLMIRSLQSDPSAWYIKNNLK